MRELSEMKGRKEFDPDKANRVIEWLIDNDGRVHACRYAGISYDTLQIWLQTNADFASEVKKAEDHWREKLRKDMLEIVRNAASKSWQAGAWILERMYSDIYALRTKQELSGYLEKSETDMERRNRLSRVKDFLNTVPIGKQVENKETEKVLP